MRCEVKCSCVSVSSGEVCPHQCPAVHDLSGRHSTVPWTGQRLSQLWESSKVNCNTNILLWVWLKLNLLICISVVNYDFFFFFIFTLPWFLFHPLWTIKVAIHKSLNEKLGPAETISWTFCISASSFIVAGTWKLSRLLPRTDGHTINWPCWQFTQWVWSFCPVTLTLIKPSQLQNSWNS